MLLALLLGLVVCVAAENPADIVGAPHANICQDIDELIRSGDYAEARRLAQHYYAALVASSSTLKERADCSYYLGVTEFLESNDSAAELHLGEAAKLYSKCDPVDIVGNWKSIKLILRLEKWRWSNILASRNGDVAGHTRLKNTARQLEEILYRRALEVGDQDNGATIYSQLQKIPDIQKGVVALQARTEQLKELSDDSNEVVGDLSAWRESISAELERLSETLFWVADDETRKDYLTALDARFIKIKTHVVDHVKAEILKQTKLVDASLQVRASAKKDGTAIEGCNDSGVRWAYEFVRTEASGKISLEDSKGGMVVYQDEELIAKALVTGQSTGSSKSDLLFFDAKTLLLVSHVRIPNVVVKVGRLSKKNTVYAVSITSGKYNYDDAPLVLCLMDLQERQIDRVKLIADNYWLATANPTSISAAGDSITLTYDASLSGQESNDYVVAAPTNSHFKSVKINLRSAAQGSLGDKGLAEKAAEEFRQQSLSDLAAISVLGGTTSSLKSLPYESLFSWGLKAAEDSVAHVGGKNPGIHFVRSLPTGELSDVWIDALKASVVSVGAAHPQLPGVFADGTLRCVLEGQLTLVRDGVVIRPHAANSAFSFNAGAAFGFPLKQREQKDSFVPSEYERMLEDLSKADIVAIDSAGKTTKVNFDRVPQSRAHKKSMWEGHYVFPEKGTVVSVARNWSADGYVYTRQQYGIDDGSRRGCIFTNVTGNTGGGYAEYGASSPGWHVASMATEIYTSSMGYSIVAKSDDGRHTFVVAERLPETPSPVELRVLNENNLNIFYSYGGIARLTKFSRNGSLLDQTEWTFSPLDGEPLVLSEKNLVFIPKPGGYNSYRVFEGSKPEKAFEILFRGGLDYAIVLPNGFYAGSPGCEHLITLKADGDHVDASALAPWRNRPAEVMKALGGDTEQIAAVEAVTQRWLKRLGQPTQSSAPRGGDIPKIELADEVPLWANRAGIAVRFRVVSGGRAPSDGVLGAVQSILRGAGSPIERLLVRVNGVEQVGASAVEKSDGEWVQEVRLAEGQNWIEASAIDANGRSSNLLRFRVLLAEAEAPVRRYIIALGVSEYSEAGLNLTYAAKDAQDVADTLRGTGGECETLVLLNGDVTKDSLAKIGEFLKPVRENDEVVVFCAGHGVLDRNLDYVFASHDFDPERPAETGIKLDDLIDTIGKSKSLKRLLLLDTCHAGKVGEREEILLAQAGNTLPKGVRAVRQRGMSVTSVEGMTAESQQRFIEEMFSLPGLHRGINVIGASGGAEFALESEKWNNGVFTAALIEALRDRKADANSDDRVGVAELRSYLAYRVSMLTGGAQKPSVVAFERDQDFDIIKVSNQKATRVVRKESASNTGGTAALAESNMPMPAKNSGEEVIRAFFAGLGNRDESEVSQLLGDRVDYYSSGKTTKTKVLADIKADWKRWSRGSFRVSDFQSQGVSTLGFVLDYELDDGKRPRSGKLNVTADVTGSPLRITRLKYKVIAAD